MKALVSLKELASPAPNSFVDGPFGSNLKASEYQDTGIPIIRLQNIRPHQFLAKDIKFISEHKATELARHDYRPGDLVIAKLGDPTGVACIVPDEIPAGRIVADVVRFRGDCDRVCHAYVSRFLNSPDAREQLERGTTGTTRKRINLTKLKSVQIPLPPVAEQKRIAAILDTADALRAKSGESLAKLDAFLQSTFYDTFGDPVSNPKGWDSRTLRELGEVVTGNTPSRMRPEYYGDHLEWIKSDNINHGSFFLSEAEERLSIAGRKVARIVPKGSILVTCIAGSPSSIGNAAIADRLVAFNQQINAFVPGDRLNVWFAFGMFRFGKLLVQRASTNSMKGMVSKSAFVAIHFPVPPRPLQDRFAAIAESVAQQKVLQRTHLAELDTLFASLQSRAFGGDL